MQEDSISRRVWMKFYSQNSTRRLGWAFRASSKLLFFSTRTSSSSAISARLATTSVQRSRNFIIVAEGVDSGITGKLVWVFRSWFPWWRFGRVAGILCLPLLTWHKHVGSRGVSGSAHAHLSGRKQFVLKCDWTAAACTWKWMTAHGATHQRWRADNASISSLTGCQLSLHKHSFSAMAVLISCVFYCCFSVLFLLKCASFSFDWFKPLTEIIFLLFVYTCLIYSQLISQSCPAHICKL